MTEGIFNPYEEEKKKKQNFQSPLDADNPYDTERPRVMEPEVTLDSGPYIMKLQVGDLKDIPDKLGMIISHLRDTDPGHLIRAGVTIIPRGQTYQADANEVHMSTADGHLCVYIEDAKAGSSAIRDQVFRRIGHMLYTLNKPEVLNKLGASVTMRG